MRKTLLIIVSSLGTLFFAGNSIESFATGTNGYDVLKTAMKNTHKVENASAMIAMNVSMNDKVIHSVTMDSAYSLSEKLGNSNIIVENGQDTIDLNVFYQNNDLYIKKNDVNYLIKGNKISEKLKLNQEMLGLIEKGIDTLTFQTHNDFIINGNTITADLPADKIPLIIQRGSQFLIKKITSITPMSEYLGADFSPLFREAQLEHVKISTTLTKEKLVDFQSIFVKFSGKDASGVKRTIVTETYIDYSDINNTYIEPVNIDYNNVITPF